MSKELTHRADELKGLGWSNDEVSRYAELWDYRQRWGAINLEREDRQFLRKAEAALPKIVSSKTSTKKPIQEKSYYRRLCFYLQSMDEAEFNLGITKGDRGMWPILLEEELRVLDYYEPVLGLPDTLKAKALDSFREEVLKGFLDTNAENIQILKFDFHKPLENLKAKEDTKWRVLREVDSSEDKSSYPVLHASLVETFRTEVRNQIPSLIRETLPSLTDIEKPLPPNDWVRK